MIPRLGHWFITASRNWWLVATIMVAQIVTTQALFAAEAEFTRITGLPVFDTQNGLTTDILLDQLPLYTGAAAGAYGWFAIVDVVFPLVAAVFLSVVWALQLRLNHSPLAAWLLQRHLPVFPLVVTLADWAENLALIGVIWLVPASEPLAMAAIVAKRLKLATLTATMLGTWLLLLLLLGNLARRRLRRYEVDRG